MRVREASDASLLENMPLGFGDVAALVEAGAHVNETDGDGCTTLFLSSEQGHVQAVTELLAANADVNQANNGDTALIVASHKGHADIVNTLLAANANVDQVNAAATTPLFVACRQGHTEVVTTLLAANASVNLASNHAPRRYTSLARRATPRSPRSCSLRTPRWTGP